MSRRVAEAVRSFALPSTGVRETIKRVTGLSGLCSITENTPPGRSTRWISFIRQEPIFLGNVVINANGRDEVEGVGTVRNLIDCGLLPDFKVGARLEHARRRITAHASTEERAAHPQ